jgi:hypothetical protein
MNSPQQISLNRVKNQVGIVSGTDTRQYDEMFIEKKTKIVCTR